GGNNTFPVPINRDGRDIYRELLGYKPNYVPPHGGKGKKDDQNAAKNALKQAIKAGKNPLYFTKGGEDNSGLLHPAQLGGYDISKIKVNGTQSISIKGLKLSDGSTVKNNVLVVDLPHPTFLSMTAIGSGGKSKVDSLVKKKTKPLETWRDGPAKWKITPDEPFKPKAAFFRKASYTYGRGEIGQEYYDFGTPGNRMVSKSSAKRIDPLTILLGVRQDKSLGKKHKGIADLKTVRPAQSVDSDEMFTSISRTTDERTDFDPGPGDEFARVIKQGVAKISSKMFANKSGKSVFKGKSQKTVQDGVAALNIKSFPNVGDFGHYRGSFEDPQVVVVADPDGWDDIITARALTGMRGQHLHALVSNIKVGSKKVGSNYLVIKTVPYGMEGATDTEWNKVLSDSKVYRDDILDAVMDKAGSKVKLFIADGKHAASYLEGYADDKKIPFVAVSKTSRLNGSGKVKTQSAIDTAYKANMADADKKIDKVSGITGNYPGKRLNIPSGHLSYYARVWEGTSGDRVITADGKTKGLAFAQVVPQWVMDQRLEDVVGFNPETMEGMETLVEKLCKAELPLPGEKIKAFESRTSGTVNCSSSVVSKAIDL
ncbi:MAG: hypothetical protein AAF203_05215, partial [Pseudomonadota bacterium]